MSEPTDVCSYFDDLYLVPHASVLNDETCAVFCHIPGGPLGAMSPAQFSVSVLTLCLRWVHLTSHMHEPMRY